MPRRRKVETSQWPSFFSKGKCINDAQVKESIWAKEGTSPHKHDKKEQKNRLPIRAVTDKKRDKKSIFVRAKTRKKAWKLPPFNVVEMLIKKFLCGKLGASPLVSCLGLEMVASSNAIIINNMTYLFVKRWMQKERGKTLAGWLVALIAEVAQQRVIVQIIIIFAALFPLSGNHNST